MDWIIDIHGRLGNTALFFTIAMAIWSFFKFFRKQGPDGNYWGALVIAEVVYVIQGLLGAIIMLLGIGVVDNLVMHSLYGVLSLLPVPGMFIYSRGKENTRTMLIFGLVLIAQIALILRGMATA